MMIMNTDPIFKLFVADLIGVITLVNLAGATNNKKLIRFTAWFIVGGLAAVDWFLHM